MSTRDPVVTVVIPAWDTYAGEMLSDAVASVRAQDEPAALVTVDNASTAPVPAPPPGELVRLERRVSTGAARNAGLARVRTPYVVFLDADDVLLDGALAALVARIERDDHLAAYTLSILDGATGQRHRSPRRLARALSRLPRAFAFANSVWSLLPTQGCTIMRTDDVRACGGYADASHGEDWALGVSLAYRGRVAFDSRPGLEYRQRVDSPGAVRTEAPVLLANAKRIRERIRSDSGVPRTAKLALPLVALLQWLAALVAHPLYRSARALAENDPRS